MTANNVNKNSDQFTDKLTPVKIELSMNSHSLVYNKIENIDKPAD